jgi:hypothetical protein
MNRNIIAGLMYLIGALIALYVTGFRLFVFVWEMFTKTPETDSVKNLLIYNVPDFISVIFCAGYIGFFGRKIANLIKAKQVSG